MKYDLLTIILYIAAAISGALLFYSFIIYVFSGRIKTSERLRAQASEKALSFDDLEIEKAIRLARGQQGFKGSLLTGLGRIFSIVPLQDSYLKKQKKFLVQAGLLMRPQELLGIKFFSGLIFSLLGFLFTRSVLPILPLFLLGWIIPGFVVKRIRSRRALRLNAQLPEALSIIANGIRAGFSFPQSIALVIKELDDPLKEEFAKLLQENSLGISMDDALQNLSDRTIDEDLDIFITALLIQRQVGGNLAEVLDTISETIRERVRLKGEILSMTAQGRLSAIIVTLVPFVVAFALQALNPGYMSIMFESPIGLIMIGASLFMMVIGILVMRRIIDLKV